MDYVMKSLVFYFGGYDFWDIWFVDINSEVYHNESVIFNY